MDAKQQNKINKSKGLQKLKFYCQVCLKQCRDANGFKNHVNSPSHLHKVSVLSVGDINEYSKQFETSFLSQLRRSHGTKKVNANKFYQEIILEKDHVHLNSTRYSSLTHFLKALGQRGVLRIDNENDEEFNLTIQLVDGSEPLKTKEPTVNETKQREKFIAKQIEQGLETEDKEDSKKKIKVDTFTPIKLKKQQKPARKSILDSLED